MTTVEGSHSKAVFERAVAAVVAVNAAAMVWGMVDVARAELAERIELGCLALFAVELAWRSWQAGWGFLRSRWGVFDVIVVALALAPLPVNTSVLRLLRLCPRVAHLGRHVVALAR